MQTSAYELYARKTVNRTVSVLYIGIVFVLVILWFFVPIDPTLILVLFFVWLILGQTYLNLLSSTIYLIRARHKRNAQADQTDHPRTPVTPQPETDAQTDQTDHLPLSKHYKVTFSKNARVHFLGVWFVTTSKTSVQAFTS